MKYEPRKNEEFFITYQITFRSNDRVENFSKHRDHVKRELELQFGSSLVDISPAQVIGNVMTKVVPAAAKKTSTLGRIGNALGSIFGVEGDDE